MSQMSCFESCETLHLPQQKGHAVHEQGSKLALCLMQINPGVALQLLKLVPVPKGEFILQNAAGSVVGRILIRLAGFYGFKTINVVRRKAQAQELLKLG